MCLLFSLEQSSLSLIWNQFVRVVTTNFLQNYENVLKKRTTNSQENKRKQQSIDLIVLLDSCNSESLTIINFYTFIFICTIMWDIL